MLAELGGKSDFRTPQPNTEVQTVLVAAALAVKWMNQHPECTAAAWIQSGIAKEWDHRGQGKGALYEKACTLMGDPEYVNITEEYKRNSGIGDTCKVLLLDQVCTAVLESSSPKHSEAIKEQIGSIPWFRDAATGSRKRYLESQTVAQWQRQRTEPPAAEAQAVARRAKMAEVTASAVAKIRAETRAKEEEAERK